MAVQTANLSSLSANTVFNVDASTLPSVGTVGVQIGGTWVGTLAFQATIDGVNWFGVYVTPITSAGGPQVATTTTNGQFAISVFGFNQVRVIFTAYTAGLAVVSLDATVAVVPVFPPAQAVVYQDNSGGPPLSTGMSLSTGAPGSSTAGTSSPEQNLQGQGYAQVQIQLTAAGDTQLTFIDNPWIQGLDLGDTILLSGGINGGAKEQVIVAMNNIPVTTAGPLAVVLVSPVVFAGSNYATFDNFTINGPGNAGCSVMGTPNVVGMLYDPLASDPKRTLKPWNQAPNNPGMGGVISVSDAVGGTDEATIKHLLMALLQEQRVTNALLLQMKDGGSMEVPVGYMPLPSDSGVM